MIGDRAAPGARLRGGHYAALRLAGTAKGAVPSVRRARLRRGDYVARWSTRVFETAVASVTTLLGVGLGRWGPRLIGCWRLNANRHWNGYRRNRDYDCLLPDRNVGRCRSAYNRSDPPIILAHDLAPFQMSP